MRRLFRFLIQLLSMALAFMAITVLWVIFDGLNDEGESADVALVVGREGTGAGDEPALERAAKLYKIGEFPRILIAGDTGVAYDELAVMTRYLEQHGVPSSAIIEDSGARDAGELARDVAHLRQERDFSSLMIVTAYYRMSRLKLALLHAGVSDLRKTHVGTVHAADALPIAEEVFALYAYVGRTFLLPAAEQVKQEATTEAEKAKVEAEKAQNTVNKGLDSLPK